MTTTELPSPAEVLRAALQGSCGLSVWTIDAAWPPEESDQHRRVGRAYVQYTDPDGGLHRMACRSDRAQEMLRLVGQHPPTEWAAAYDDFVQADDPDIPPGVGDQAKPRQMAYRGRLWEIGSELGCPHGNSLCEDVYEFCLNDVGAAHYLEKDDQGLWEYVI